MVNMGDNRKGTNVILIRHGDLYEPGLGRRVAWDMLTPVYQPTAERAKGLRAGAIRSMSATMIGDQ